MKTATIPSLRVESELRDAAESVLQNGESLSSFVEQSIRASIERRQTQQAFIAGAWLRVTRHGEPANISLPRMSCASLMTCVPKQKPRPVGELSSSLH